MIAEQINLIYNQNKNKSKRMRDMMNVEFLKENGIDVDKSLELFGDMQTYNDTIGEFILGASQKLPKLEEYKNKKDMNNYAIYVHSLKSDAKYFGFTKLAELAYNQEIKSKAGDIYYIYDTYDDLINETNRLIHVVKQYLGKEEPQEESPEILTEPTIVANREVYIEPTILVADDSNIVRNFVSRIFDGIYKVGVAKDGKEALEIIKSNQNNDNLKAILLDLNMPEVDGFTVLEYMKENRLFTEIPVSIISGDSSKETIDKAFTYQIVDMIKKPFNDTDIKRVVEKTIYFKEMN